MRPQTIAVRGASFDAMDARPDGSTRARPPALPIERPAAPWRLARIIALGVTQAVTLLLLDRVLGGLTIDDISTALGMVAVLGLLNALVWPTVIRITLPVVIFTVGLFTFVLNALFVWAAAAIVSGVRITSFWTALVVALLMTIVNLAVGGVLHIDGDHVWRSKVARRVIRRTEGPPSRPTYRASCSSRSTGWATTCSTTRMACG